MKNTLDSALYEAVAARRVEEVRSLLAQGANPNALDPDQVASHYERTPLREALEPAIEPFMEIRPAEVLEGQPGQSEVVRLLLEYGADPNTENPLIKATYYGLINSVRLLLEYGADPNQENGEALYDAKTYHYHTIYQMLMAANSAAMP